MLKMPPPPPIVLCYLLASFADFGDIQDIYWFGPHLLSILVFVRPRNLLSVLVKPAPCVISAMSVFCVHCFDIPTAAGNARNSQLSSPLPRQAVQSVMSGGTVRPSQYILSPLHPYPPARQGSTPCQAASLRPSASVVRPPSIANFFTFLASCSNMNYNLELTFSLHVYCPSQFRFEGFNNLSHAVRVILPVLLDFQGILQCIRTA